MPKNRLQQFIDLHSQFAATTNGFAHEIHLGFVELGRILEGEFDHKKDKSKSEVDKFLQENFSSKIPSQKELLYLKYPNCAICGKRFKNVKEATKDHIKPRAKGGTNDINNLQLTCMACNSRKADFYNAENPNALVYLKNKTNIRFMLEQNNLIEGIDDSKALEKDYIAWNYLWTHKELTVKFLKKCFIMLSHNDDLVEYNIEMDSWLSTWINEIKHHTTFEQIKEDHINFMYVRPFPQNNERFARIVMNWQLAKAGLPLCVVLNKDKDKYFEWFKTEN